MCVGNPEEATIHGKLVHGILRKLYHTRGRDAVNREMLRHAQYNHVYLATLQVRRPIFPLNGWVMDYLSPLLAPIDEASNP
jgi:hypothetical protein